MSGGLGTRVRGVAGASGADARGAAGWFSFARRVWAAGFSDRVLAPAARRGERGGAGRPLHGEKGEGRGAGTSAHLAGRVAGTDWPSAPDASAGQGGWRLPFPSRPME